MIESQNNVTLACGLYKINLKLLQPDKTKQNETKQEGYRNILFATAQGLGCSILSLFKFIIKRMIMSLS